MKLILRRLVEFLYLGFIYLPNGGVVVVAMPFVVVLGVLVGWDDPGLGLTLGALAAVFLSSRLTNEGVRTSFGLLPLRLWPWDQVERIRTGYFGITRTWYVAWSGTAGRHMGGTAYLSRRKQLLMMRQLLDADVIPNHVTINVPRWRGRAAERLRVRIEQRPGAGKD